MHTCSNTFHKTETIFFFFLPERHKFAEVLVFEVLEMSTTARSVQLTFGFIPFIYRMNFIFVRMLVVFMSTLIQGQPFNVLNQYALQKDHHIFGSV